MDEHGAVLLVRVIDPVDGRPPIWLTPGGGIEKGETLAQAAARELAEETGLVAPAQQLGDAIAVARGEWTFRGERLTSEDWFFLCQTSRFVPDVSGQEELEWEIHGEWRWWTVPELMCATEAVLPSGLADLLASLGRVDRQTPVELPWFVP